MIITSIDELRFSFPAHALSTVNPLSAFFDNSETDFLLPVLGKPLYDKLLEYYNSSTFDVMAYCTRVKTGDFSNPYDRLLMRSQRIVAFDTFGRAIGVQAISINNAGLNVSTADDYEKPSKELIDVYSRTCNNEGHRAINTLLQDLENWCKVVKHASEPDPTLRDIVTAWQHSRYYYLCGKSLLSSASVVQEFINLFDNRERYINLIPDILDLQEEVFAQQIGYELLDYFVTKALEGSEVVVVNRIIHKLRKALAFHLKATSDVIRLTKELQAVAHDKAQHYTAEAIEYIEIHQNELPTDAHDALVLSPLYKKTDTEQEVKPTFENGNSDNAFFVTPMID